MCPGLGRGNDALALSIDPVKGVAITFHTSRIAWLRSQVCRGSMRSLSGRTWHGDGGPTKKTRIRDQSRSGAPLAVTTRPSRAIDTSRLNESPWTSSMEFNRNSPQSDSGRAIPAGSRRTLAKHHPDSPRVGDHKRSRSACRPDSAPLGLREVAHDGWPSAMAAPPGDEFRPRGVVLFRGCTKEPAARGGNGLGRIRNPRAGSLPRSEGGER